MAHTSWNLNRIVFWDAEFKRPVVDGKFAHPLTGEILQAGNKGLIDGPPSIEIRLFNVDARVNVLNINQSTPLSIDALYTAVSKQVEKGIFSIISVNASQYSFTLVCQILVTKEEFDLSWKNLF